MYYDVMGQGAGGGLRADCLLWTCRTITAAMVFHTVQLYHLCKQARDDSHFLGHVSPIFCNISAFSLYLPTPIFDSLTFFFLWPFWFLTLPKLSLTLVFNVIGHVSLLSHFPPKFQLKEL